MANAHSFNRRNLLKLAPGVGLSWAGLLRAQSAFAETKLGTPKIRSCIIVFYYGGPSHLDTYDMKPHASNETRGPFNPIASSVMGLPVCEHLPHMAKIMHKVAVVRSMHHTNRLHDSASTESLTGRQSPQGDREEFAPIAQFYPCYGATLSYKWRHRKLDLVHAALPWVFHNVVPTPAQGGGFLGAAYDPFRINGEPTTSTYRAEMFDRPAGLTMRRILERRQLRAAIASGSDFDQFVAADRLQGHYQRAFELMQSKSVRKALDIKQESKKTRERYGLYQNVAQQGGNGAERSYGHNLRGQNLLMARRLVEAGVPFINIYDYRQQGQNWDSHKDNFNQHKKYLLPPADKSLSALIEDLDQRGLLDSTLVVAMGEFGRTPKINAQVGRDHWPDCYSVLFAGGGVKGGFIYGASDKIGAYPVTDPVTPANLAATIYWRFGLDPAGEIPDQTGRPYRLADGKPIKELFV